MVVDDSTGWPVDLETWKSQGILLARNKYHRFFSKIHSSSEQEVVKPVPVSRMLMDFYLRIKMNLNCGIVFFFFLFGSESVLLLIKLYYMYRDENFRFEFSFFYTFYFS